MRGISDNLDFLSARLHGRRSQMAEGEKLEALCRVPTMELFTASIFPGTECRSAAEMQLCLLRKLAEEASDIAAQLSSPGADLVHWLVRRFQVENLKIILRGVLTGSDSEACRRHLLPLPREYSLGIEDSDVAKSFDELLRRLPRGGLRTMLMEAIGLYPGNTHPFFYEAALDHGYFEELLGQTEALTGEDRELVKPMVTQEIDAFHLILVARGRFIHQLDGKMLLPLHVPDTRISRGCFAAMLAAPDLRAAAVRALGRAIDELPGESGNSATDAGLVSPAGLERLTRQRFRCLTNRAFRRSHMGLAVVVAFIELRRLEVANLITLSEGIRVHAMEGQIQEHLVRAPEVAHA
jgi:V/A-type H+/Na+-transporting ATPase subunit C